MKRLLGCLLLLLTCFISNPLWSGPKCRPKTVAPHLVPQAAHRVFAHVKAKGAPLPGYVGGRRFGNYGSGGEQKLPIQDAAGKRIQYQEWDIYPKEPRRNRGPERLVTGSDGRGWYTADHYCTFTEIR